MSPQQTVRFESNDKDDAGSEIETMGRSMSDPKKIANVALRELFIAQMEALVEEMGGERTNTALTPFYKHAGMASATNFLQAMGFKDIGPLEIGQICRIALSAMGYRMRIVVREDGVQFLHTGICPIRKAPKEACFLLEGIMGKANMNTLNQDYVFVIDGWDENNPYCRKTGSYVSRGGLPSGAVLTEWELAECRKIDMGMDIEDLAAQYYGEFLVLNTIGTIPVLGKERTIDILSQAAKACGARLMMEGLFDPILHDEPPPSVAEEAERMLALLNMKSRPQQSKDKAFGFEVTSCPFSNAPPELCDQLHQFMEGVLSVSEPNITLDIERKMTTGGGTCLQVARTNGAGKIPIKVDAEGPLKVLKMRLAKGEISPEEYQSVKRMLME